MKRTFNVYSDNYFEFPNMIFVYTSITLKSRHITFNGVAIDMLNDSKFVAYKNSTIKLEVLSSFYISLAFIFKLVIIVIIILCASFI